MTNLHFRVITTQPPSRGMTKKDFTNKLQLESVYKLDQSPFSVIPACPESFLNNPLPPPFLRGNRKDSRRASLAGMTNILGLLTNTCIEDKKLALIVPFVLNIIALKNLPLR